MARGAFSAAILNKLILHTLQLLAVWLPVALLAQKVELFNGLLVVKGHVVDDGDAGTRLGEIVFLWAARQLAEFVVIFGNIILEHVPK